METQKKRHWYNDREIALNGFIHSNYITALTDWFMGFAGKATVLVLYFTVLYSCIQLYPKVNLPDGLSLAIFIIQMGALDIGGLSLGTLARQTKKAGNTIEAQHASRLSKALISIMLLGVVTVSIGHVVTIEPHWFAAIQIVQVVARSICAVLYGRVVHDLKQETMVIVSVPEFEGLVKQVQEMEQKTTQRFNLLNVALQSMTNQIQENKAIYDASISESEQRIAYFLMHQLQGFTESFTTVIDASKTPELPFPKTDEKPELKQGNKTAFTPDENEEYNDVLTTYNTLASWVSTGRKTATLEEISEATERSLRIVQNRVKDGVIKRSGRNANLYSIASVLAWVKQDDKAGNKSKETRKLPALKLVKKA